MKLPDISGKKEGNDFKKDYQPRTNIVKDEKVYLVADSYSIVARWMNYVFISPSY